MTSESIPTADEIRRAAATAAFGHPLISNIYRGLIAEIIVDAALGGGLENLFGRLARMGF
jgi:hypothetical protein